MFALLFFYDTLSWGLVMYKFWGWFLLPIFPMLPVITFVQAIGLMFFAGLLKYHNVTAIKKEYKDYGMEITVALILLWVTLIFGWLAYVIFLA